MRAEELLTARDHVLVAFDGPVAELPATSSGAERLRVMVSGGRLPRKVAHTADPFVVLGHAATIGPATEKAVYTQLCRLEREMVAGAAAAPGVREAFATMAAAGTQVTVVSGLDSAAVRMFLVLHGLDEHVRAIAGRTGPDRKVLPPAPDLISRVVHERAMVSCVFVGSTVADLAAGRAAGVEILRHRRLSHAESARPWFDGLSEPGPR
jgi:phosphoglycolate phosphatase-like HAD superfamily hydrolase